MGRAWELTDVVLEERDVSEDEEDEAIAEEQDESGQGLLDASSQGLLAELEAGPVAHINGRVPPIGGRVFGLETKSL